MTEGVVLWFTGLSGAGKSTVAQGVGGRLDDQRYRTLILDGDDIRARHHRDLGFGEAEVKENNALIAKMCAARRAEHDVILVPIISPFSESRARAGALLGPGFFEVYCKAELSVLERRDVKGLYAKARRGEISDLIGYSPRSVYEPPATPDIVLETDSEKPEHSIERLFRFVRERAPRSRFPRMRRPRP